jgi:hypothetical protein
VPERKAEPPSDVSISFTPGEPQAFQDFLIAPSKPGHLAVMIDFLLEGSCFV